MIPITSRFAIWPRGGIGYASRQNAPSRQGLPANAPDNKDSFSALILSADVPFIYRINETFFVSAAPSSSSHPREATRSTFRTVDPNLRARTSFNSDWSPASAFCSTVDRTHAGAAIRMRCNLSAASPVPLAI